MIHQLVRRCGGPRRTSRSRALSSVACLLLIGCAPAKGAPSPRTHSDAHENNAPVTIGAEERQAYERARPVFERYCAACHSSVSGNEVALGHFAMDTYPFEGHHAAEIAGTIRRVLGATGERPTMPLGRPGVVRDAELQVILDWALTFERTHDRESKQHSGHHRH